MRGGLPLLLLAASALAQAEERVRVVPAFPKLSFEEPLFLAFPPDGTDRLFVAEQGGRVKWFQNDPAAAGAAVALDLSAKILRRHNEEGLLGLAFHPRFAENGFLFLFYTADRPRRSVVARFTLQGGRADPASEKVILEAEKPYGNHNGGMLAFGPDGYLYISLGDGGSAGDPHNHGQRKDVLLGKILRIDADRSEGGRAYAVPPDNPFAGEKGSRGEIWAWGLRNVWRFSFDRATGRLWAADVGQDEREEVDLIEKGLNYGWNIREGRRPFKDRPSPVPLKEPVIDHGRDEAQSLTGGYVYRGRRCPSLAGAYIYGDFMTGLIWALRGEGGRAAARRIGRGELISSFGEDKEGEVYFTSYDGNIYTFAEGR